MYSRQEASQLREEFWTAFGKYMQPILSAEGERINWINYKTGVKHISFKINAAKGASIAIEISHPDLDEQKNHYQKFEQLRLLLNNALEEDWNWIAAVKDENDKLVSRIYLEITDVHILNKADWPTLISFFKPRIIRLDQFWSNVKPLFEM